MDGVTRRRFLAAAAASAAGLALPAAAGTRGVALVPGPGRARLVPEPHGATGTWCYNGAVPGPLIRARQGERLRVAVTNALGEETTVHWHGVRVPNGMDGVPHLTQDPIPPGGGFVYEFDAVDAGTFWYHPHLRGSEQLGRGLYGALVVDEPEPPPVDREAIWILDDWRLDRSAAIREDFGNRHDAAHAGRIGNTVTINGRPPGAFRARAGERIRLRLINVANARVFALEFRHHSPVVIALDGQPVAPHEPPDGLVTLGPSMRADLILDMTEAPGRRSAVVDRFYRGRAYRLVDVVYEDAPLRDRPPPGPPPTLPANPLPEPDLARARRVDVVLNGGMMGGRVMAEMGGSMGGGGFWFLNGEAAARDRPPAPMLALRRGESCVVAMTNATAWHHPMHLHGHAFRVVSRDGAAPPLRERRDTVLMAPREKTEIAFVADNPGDWLLHCHVLEHHETGMAGVVRVA